MIINSNTNTLNFKAKFLQSQALTDVAKYAVENNQFEKLNQARKNIDTAFLRTRLLFDMGVNEKGYPYISFIKYEPKSFITIPQSINDYKEYPPVIITGQVRNENPLKFALKKLILMGNCVPKNKIFKNIVIQNK